MISTEKQRLEIKSFIQDELLKRGFTVVIELFDEVQGRSNSRFEFQTANFQTVPVLFKEVQVNNFSSSIGAEETLEDEGYVYRPFWIEVSVSYKHFGGGTNGCRLFTVTGHLAPNGNTYELKAY